MTIPTENDNLNQVVATGGEVTIAYDFKLLDQDHLVVTRTRAGVDTTLVLSTNYTVSGVGNPAGGTITLLVAAVADDVYTLALDIPFTRLSDYSTGGDYLAATVNTELDSIIQMLQQVDRDKNRALRMAVSDTFNADNLLLPVDRASSLLGFDASRVPYAAAIADLGVTVASVYALTLLDDANAAAARATLEMAGGKWNMAATTDPTVTDDSSEGYAVGSLWLDVTNDRLWVCVDPSVGAAVWQPASLPVTTAGDIVYRGANRLERLALGAAGTHLVGGAEPSWVSGASQRLSDSWVYSTGVTALEFETGFDDGYDHLFVISNVAPDVADTLNFRVKEGGSYVDTLNSYRYGGMANTTTTAGGGVGQATLGATTSSNVATTEHISGTLLLHNPASPSFRTECEFLGSAASSATATGKKTAAMSTEREAPGACQGVRFLWGGSNDFAAGAITHYRRKTT